ncbi:MAG: hypothetical protein KKG59_01960 [Nanoarchaeota archaeon]|nr:hypothetical protein [Nanoarchaeota archaeon]
MLDHIEDLRTLTGEDFGKLVAVFNESYSVAVDNPRYRSATEIGLLVDIAQSLRDIKELLGAKPKDED